MVTCMGGTYWLTAEDASVLPILGCLSSLKAHRITMDQYTVEAPSDGRHQNCSNLKSLGLIMLGLLHVATFMHLRVCV